MSDEQRKRNYIIQRHACLGAPQLLEDATENDLIQELHRIHDEFGDSGFNVYELGQSIRFLVRTRIEIAKG